MVETEKAENIEFHWGKKKGIGGKKKDVTFYESFTYDGVEYFLYDSVYLYKVGETEPYIGKILKIWQNPDKTKKVKILWFFRADEILNYLGAEDPPNNELFLASGDGIGLANVNPLEVIAGKCNVVCISNDSRNLRPSEETIKNADFVFRRTFDVGKLEVCNEISEKIAGVEVNFLLNRVDTLEKDGKSPDKDEKDRSGSPIVNTELENSSGKNTLRTYENIVDKLTKEKVDLKSSLLKRKSSEEEQSGACASVEGNEILNTGIKQENILDGKVSPRIGVDQNKAQGKDVKVPVKGVELGDRIKSPRGSAEVEHRPAKKAKLDTSVQVSAGKTNDSTQRFCLNRSNGDTLASSPKNVVSEDASKTKNVRNSHGSKDGLINRPKPEEKPLKVSNGKTLTTSSKVSSDKNCKIDGQTVEVTKRPDADRSRWFKGHPWEERMKIAHEQGTLVLIQNLDPAYTSGEVEDIVWHAFGESCTAKMLQRTAFFLPHIGQAYVAFKTKEAAEKVVRKLDEGCLLLPNGRAVVGSFATPFFPAKKPTFFGHHSIDRLKHQMQRDMKDAVSTSHCSQPNTIEYDMAMEWCLLQEKTELACKKLFKQQEEEFRKLKSRLKSG